MEVPPWLNAAANVVARRSEIARQPEIGGSQADTGVPELFDPPLTTDAVRWGPMIKPQHIALQ
jgi:hypothetical protein